MTTPGYKAVKMAWLDITGCGTSDYPAKVGNYEVKSPAWRTSFSGRLVSATGHEHDGGSEVNIYKNGKSVCNSAQIYGRKPAWVGGMEGLKIAHISDTGSCVDFGDLKIGDSLAIGAKYNTTAHSLNKKMSGAGNSPIMGIAQVRCFGRMTLRISAYGVTGLHCLISVCGCFFSPFGPVYIVSGSILSSNNIPLSLTVLILIDSNPRQIDHHFSD